MALSREFSQGMVSPFTILATVLTKDEKKQKATVVDQEFFNELFRMCKDLVAQEDKFHLPPTAVNSIAFAANMPIEFEDAQTVW